MKVYTDYIQLTTQGNSDIIDITSQVEQIVNKSKINDGIVTVFVPGATGSVTTIEYEKELIKDTKEMFSEIIPENKLYHHNKTHFQGNATSHLRATLLGPSLCIPVTNSELQLGTWQQIVFIDFDNRPRNRKLIVKVIGVTKE